MEKQSNVTGNLQGFADQEKGKEELDFITFASSSTVRNFVEIIGQDNLDKINSSKVISIGPITSATAEELNINVYKEAEKATIDKIVEAITIC